MKRSKHRTFSKRKKQIAFLIILWHNRGFLINPQSVHRQMLKIRSREQVYKAHQTLPCSKSKSSNASLQINPCLPGLNAKYHQKGDNL